MTGELRHPAWRKSSYSTAYSNCVEVAALGGPAIGLRDSKDPDGPILAVQEARWSAFLHGIATDDLDH